MYRRPVIARYAIAALVLSLGSASVPCAASAQAQVPAQALAHVRIGTPGGDANAEAFYAADQGYFRKASLEAEIQVMRGSGAGTIAGVAGGAIDVAEADLVAIAAARQRGIPLVVLAPSGMYDANAPTTQLLVAKTSAIKTAKDLAGKTIAVLSLEGPSKVGTSLWIDKNGGHVADVKFIELGAPEMAEAVARGTVDAATIPEPYLSTAKEKVRVLGDVYSAIAPRFEISAWVATVDWVTKNRATARAFAQAMRDTATWANVASNHARSAEILAKYRKIELSTLARMTRATYGDAFDPALAQPLLDAALTYRSIQKPELARDLSATATGG